MTAEQNMLISLNVNDKTEKKNGLTYLSWSSAWTEFLKVYPDAKYRVIKREDGMPYFKDESGAFVYTEVTAGGITREMWLCVMDARNKAIKNPDAFDINKTIMRCLVKNLAIFGLGLYIYAGEDLPETATEEVKRNTAEQIAELEDLITKTETDKKKFLQYFKVDKMETVPYDKAKQILNKKLVKGVENANN